jgi:hypothetical protein
MIVYTNVVSKNVLIYKDNNSISGIYPWNNLITVMLYTVSIIDFIRRLHYYFSFKILKKKMYISNNMIYRALLKYSILFKLFKFWRKTNII